MRRFMSPTTLSLVLVPAVASLATALCMSTTNPSASQDDSEEAALPDTSPVTLLRGLDVPVRGRDESDVTEDTRSVSYEAYYDWDFGAVTLVSETGDIATLPAARNWELRTATDKLGDLVSICFRPASGETFLLNEAGDWEALEEVEGEEALLGDYDVRLSVSDDGLMTVLRIDYLSGRTWLLERGGWDPVAGNVEGWPE